MASPHVIPNARHLVITNPVREQTSEGLVMQDPNAETREIAIELDSSRSISMALGSMIPEDRTSRSMIEMYLVPTAWGW